MAASPRQEFYISSLLQFEFTVFVVLLQSTLRCLLRRETFAKKGNFAKKKIFNFKRREHELKNGTHPCVWCNLTAGNAVVFRYVAAIASVDNVRMVVMCPYDEALHGEFVREMLLLFGIFRDDSRSAWYFGLLNTAVIHIFDEDVEDDTMSDSLDDFSDSDFGDLDLRVSDDDETPYDVSLNSFTGAPLI